MTAERYGLKWTEKEKEELKKAAEQLEANKSDDWNSVTLKLPGRTISGCKNVWYKMKRSEEEEKEKEKVENAKRKLTPSNEATEPGAKRKPLEIEPSLGSQFLNLSDNQSEPEIEVNLAPIPTKKGINGLTEEKKGVGKNEEAEKGKEKEGKKSSEARSATEELLATLRTGPSGVVIQGSGDFEKQQAKLLLKLDNERISMDYQRLSNLSKMARLADNQEELNLINKEMERK